MFRKRDNSKFSGKTQDWWLCEMLISPPLSINLNSPLVWDIPLDMWTGVGFLNHSFFFSLFFFFFNNNLAALLWFLFANIVESIKLAQKSHKNNKNKNKKKAHNYYKKKKKKIDNQWVSNNSYPTVITIYSQVKEYKLPIEKS